MVAGVVLDVEVVKTSAENAFLGDGLWVGVVGSAIGDSSLLADVVNDGEAGLADFALVGIKTFNAVCEVTCLGKAFSACRENEVLVADLAHWKAVLVGEEFAVLGVVGVCYLEVVFDVGRIHTNVIIALLIDADEFVLANMTSDGLRNHVIGRFHLGEVEVRNDLKLVCKAARREDVLALFILVEGVVLFAVLADWGNS